MPSIPESIPMCVTQIYTSSAPDGERLDEVFLLYSKGFEYGPGIHRDGLGEPWMEDRHNPGRSITSPIEQRCGTWLIDDGLAKEVEARLIREDRTLSAKQKGEWLAELDDTPNYFEEFGRVYPEYEIMGMQGCGNLTMNLWFIAYLNSRFTGKQKQLIHLHAERHAARTYSCLVKWRRPRDRYTISDLEFLPYLQQMRLSRPGPVAGTHGDGHQPAKGDAQEEAEERDITDDIEFAIFGQRIVEDGEGADFGVIAPQFVDVRHLYKLPNINPPVALDPTRVEQHSRPRRLFGKLRDHDVWFGERQMTRPEFLNLLILALNEPILLDRDFDGMGADLDLIEATFALEGYRKTPNERIPPRARGEWRIYSDQLVQVFLQRNVYAYTMLGLNQEGNIVAVAAGGLAGRMGQTIEAMAQNIISAGCRTALLMDEGDDVFQWCNGDYTVKPRRGRVRAVFAFARQRQTAEQPHEQKRAADT